MLPDAGKRTLFHSAARRIALGSRVDTDSWHGYSLLGRLYDHRPVKHSEGYVKNGVHCNPAEAEWSVFRPWWVRFRGVAKRHIYLYLAQYEYWRNRRHWTPLERLEEMIGFLFAFLQKVATALSSVLAPLPSLELCAVSYR